MALKQHGVIALADVRTAGGRAHHVRSRVAAGRWIKVHRGVYRLAGVPWTWHGRVMAAVKAAGPGAAASFFCIPTTDIARTLLDVGGALKRRSTFARTVEQARRLEKTTRHDLIVCLAAHARRGRNGIVWLRELIAVGVANDEVTDTDSELVALALLREHGFAELVRSYISPRSPQDV